LKRAITIFLTLAALAATLTLVDAGSSKQAVGEPNVLPAGDILATLRNMGMEPIGEPARRGPYYVLHAYDPTGIEMRVVADAQFGDVLSIAPANALANIYTPQYRREPRIIHVPRRAARAERYDNRDEASLPDDDHMHIGPPVRRAVKKPPQQTGDLTPKPLHRRDLGQPTVHRNVLSAPPLASTLTPVYPTPRFENKAEAADKFNRPKDEPAADAPPANSTQHE
jgi:hypothetical protein